MSRKLASVKTISGFTPIEGADNIHIVHIDGWRVVAQKKEFHIGDKCLYIEVDSLVPSKYIQFEFLKKWGTKKVKIGEEILEFYRIKTIKLRSTISQGLCIPLHLFPELTHLSDDTDVTEKLEIRHYDPESPFHSYNVPSQPTTKDKILKILFRYKIFRIVLMPFLAKEKGAWPDWISKTDEDRIQTIRYTSLYEKYKDEVFYTTEKIDYQSATFFTKTKMKSYWGLFNKSVKIFGTCSRTQWKKTKDYSLWWQVVEKFNLEKSFKSYICDLTVQGEQGNEQVQKNKYKLAGPQLFVFNVIADGYQQNLSSMIAFCNAYHLKTVPIIDKEFKLLPTVEQMVEYSKGSSQLNPNIPREGVVVRLIKNGTKIISFKIINPEFELKYD